MRVRLIFYSKYLVHHAELLLEAFPGDVVGFDGYFAVCVNPHGFVGFDGYLFNDVVADAFDPIVVSKEGHWKCEEHLE